MTRESLLARAMVELADNLVDDFDIVELLSTLSERCVVVLDIAAAGIMLTDADGNLRAMTSSNEAMRVVEVFEVQSQEGPCLDCFHSGRPVVNQDLAAVNSRWPRFAPVAVQAGFRAADAIPMRLRGQIIGALNLFPPRRGRSATTTSPSHKPSPTSPPLPSCRTGRASSNGTSTPSSPPRCPAV